MSKLLINENPLMVLPSLASKIGLNEAIVLQQVHYWTAKGKNEIDGHSWVYNSVSEWKSQFPFWSEQTIRRTIANLKECGLLIAKCLSPDPFNRKPYYRIDHEALDSVEHSKLEPTNNHGQSDSAVDTKLEPTVDTKLEPTSNTEISSETNAETSKKHLSGKPDASPPKAAESVQEDLFAGNVHPPAVEPPKADIEAELIAYLNEAAGKGFEPVEANRKLVRARLAESTQEKVRAVIDLKVEEWGYNVKMSKFLRPATLFAAENFAQYVGELGARVPVVTQDGSGLSPREQAKQATARALFGHLIPRADNNTIEGCIHEV